METIVVAAGEADLQARALAEELALPLVASGEETSASYLLCYSEQGLVLQPGAGKTGPVRVDFVTGAAHHRRTKGGGELLVKAVAGSKQQRPTVLDTTAGLGRDSFVLASWGYPVTLLERSPIIAALLKDGLDRARAADEAELSEIIARMRLQVVKAQDYLLDLPEANWPDVVYLDPMFPPSKKSALVKKEMQAFHAVVGKEPDDAAELLELALQRVNYRVVVKRPVKAEWLGGRKPNFSLAGRAVRFDVYTVKAMPK